MKLMLLESCFVRSSYARVAHHCAFWPKVLICHWRLESVDDVSITQELSEMGNEPGGLLNLKKNRCF